MYYLRLTKERECSGKARTRKTVRCQRARGIQRVLLRDVSPYVHLDRGGQMKHRGDSTVRPVAAHAVWKITYAFHKESKDATKDKDVSVCSRVSNTPMCTSCLILLHSDSPKTKYATEDDGNLPNQQSVFSRLCKASRSSNFLPIQCTCSTGVSWVFFFNHGFGLPPGPSCKVGGVASGYWAVCILRPMRIKDRPALRRG